MRKSAFYLLIAFAGLLAACSKNSNNTDSKLIGKWQLTEYLASPGDMGEWQPYTAGLIIAEFHEDGRLEYNKSFLHKDYSRFKVVDDTKLTFYNEDFTDSATHTYSIVFDKLTIWLHCIEPCGARLTRTAGTNP